MSGDPRGLTMTAGQAFDVFLSHSSHDKPAVEALAHRLEEEAHCDGS
jgi:hypothetical protein